MTARPIPARHWRSYGDDPLPTGAEALDEPFARVPVVVHAHHLRPLRQGPDAQRGAHRRSATMPIRDILDRMRHDGCGGRAGRVELLTGIEGASSRPVRKIVLRTD